MKKQQIFRYLLLPLAIILYTCEDIDTTPPTISVSSHSSGQTVGEIVIIKVSTNDNDGIKKVEFYINNELVETISKSPFEYIWNTTKVEDGDYVIKCISYDTSDNSTESQPITLKVDNQSYSPTKVNINSIVYENSGFTITWNKSTDTDFESYQLEKSVESQMSDYTVIYSTSDINTVNYFDSDGDPLHFQYYRITVSDTLGLEKKGQILSSSLDPIPNSINVTSVSYTLTEMTVKWNKSTDTDFQHYILNYSETEDGNKSIVDTFSDIDSTFYSTIDFDPTKENWFCIEVVDTLGQISQIGNSETNSIDLPPTQSEISSIDYQNNSFIISWTINNNNDFASYELFESNNENMNGKTSVYVTNQVTDTSFIVQNIDDDSREYYQIIVADKWGLKTISTVEMGSSYKRIVFRNSLHIMDSDGNNNTVLLENGIISNNAEFIFDISPDGKEIIFSNHWDGSKVYKMNIDGTNLTNLTGNEYSIWSLRYSPDGSKIIFDDQTNSSPSPENPAASNIYIMDSDGKHLTNITNNFSSNCITPSISPDGQKIIFLNYTDNYKVHIMDIDGSNVENLGWIAYSQDSNPIMSPNEDVIIFHSYRAYWGAGIYSLDLNSKEKKVLIYMGVEPSTITVSPQGNNMAFVGYDNNKANIYIMNIDGSGLTNITNNSINGTGYGHLDFSEDGSFLTFYYTVNGFGGIHIMNLNTYEVRGLTSSGEMPKFVPR